MQHLFAGLTPQQQAEKLLGRALTFPNPEYQCQKCKDVGWIETEPDKRMKKCECLVRKEVERAIAKSGISEAFKQCTFDNFKAWDARVATARGIAEAYSIEFPNIEAGRQNSFALLGEVGSGKTMLGVCVLNSLTKRGVSVLYASYRDIMSELKGNVLDDNEYHRALDRYVKPRVLFIDDLYKGYTQNDPKYVYDVINARYLAKKPIIVTSELNADQLLDIDAAVGSRIIEMSRDYIYWLRGDGLNYRLRGL